MMTDAMNWERLVELGRELPEVTEGQSYGTAALKVRGKLLARLKEDGESVVFFLPTLDLQEFLIGAEAALYYMTDHSRARPAALARLAKLRVADARQRLEEG